ncbi:hypothetical protein I553_0024 [Mycobacterium xenopi 4042]|uniref:Uncharacterized protein n=1 Tax=Mycobacterium xenopi 4042 TaxID=1299334 RepID=X8CXC1_MYCXE|nr:hypothetical protein I553_0024 [Mycobacterium xenopi 4042]
MRDGSARRFTADHIGNRTDADPRTVAALEMAFFGALVQAAAALSPTTRSPTGSPT